MSLNPHQIARCEAEIHALEEALSHATAAWNRHDHPRTGELLVSINRRLQLLTSELIMARVVGNRRMRR